MHRLTGLLAAIFLLGGTPPSFAQTGSDIILDIPPIIAAATACEGVGEWQGTEGLINAVDFSRASGVNTGTFQGNPIVRFKDDNPTTPRVEYDICVPADGRYHVRIHTYAAGHYNNGLFIEVDGVTQAALPDHPLAGFKAIYLRKDMWSWDPQWLGSGNRHSGPVDIILKKGAHTFSFRKRKVERPHIHQIRLIKR